MTAVLARPARIAPASVGAPAPPPSWTAAWSAALAELELGVEEAEALLRAAHEPVPAGPAPAGPAPAAGLWVPPTSLGVLPAPLRQRAEALLARQLHVARSLAEAAEHSRRHLRVLDQLRQAAETTPVYLDTAG